jgi:ankyrin repeat protein
LLSYIIQLWKQGDNATSNSAADPVLPPDVEDWMPLHYAANNGHKEATIVLMLEGRADPYRKNKEGKSALDIARERADNELVEIMVSYLLNQHSSLLELYSRDKKKS